MGVERDRRCAFGVGRGLGREHGRIGGGGDGQRHRRGGAGCRTRAVAVGVGHAPADHARWRDGGGVVAGQEGDAAQRRLVLRHGGHTAERERARGSVPLAPNVLGVHIGQLVAGAQAAADPDLRRGELGVVGVAQGEAGAGQRSFALGHSDRACGQAGQGGRVVVRSDGHGGRAQIGGSACCAGFGHVPGQRARCGRGRGVHRIAAVGHALQQRFVLRQAGAATQGQGAGGRVVLRGHAAGRHVGHSPALAFGHAARARGDAVEQQHLIGGGKAGAAAQHHLGLRQAVVVHIGQLDAGGDFHRRAALGEGHRGGAAEGGGVVAGGQRHGGGGARVHLAGCAAVVADLPVHGTAGAAAGGRVAAAGKGDAAQRGFVVGDGGAAGQRERAERGVPAAGDAAHSGPAQRVTGGETAADAHHRAGQRAGVATGVVAGREARCQGHRFAVFGVAHPGGVGTGHLGDLVGVL